MTDSVLGRSALIYNAEVLPDEDPPKVQELQEFAQSSDIRYGVWVRTVPEQQKGARIKPIVFATFDIFFFFFNYIFFSRKSESL